MVHAATHVENNMVSEVEVTSCSKDKGGKNVFQTGCFYDSLHLRLQITNDFYGIDFESDKPRVNAELRVMIAQLLM